MTRIRLVPLNAAPAVEMVKDLTLVGRRADCDARIDHKSVSKLHCVLVKTDGLVLVRDLGSTNGTRVNGQRVRRAALLPNDQLAIAAFQYRVQFGDAPDRSPAPATSPVPAAAANPAVDSDEHAPLPDKPGPSLQLNAHADRYPDAPR